MKKLNLCILQEYKLALFVLLNEVEKLMFLRMSMLSNVLFTHYSHVMTFPHICECVARSLIFDKQY